jgi:hypothetical protein
MTPETVIKKLLLEMRIKGDMPEDCDPVSLGYYLFHMGVAVGIDIGLKHFANTRVQLQPVSCYDRHHNLIAEYPSIIHAARVTDCCVSSITRAIRLGTQTKKNGWYWKHTNIN